ncbi:hypothetical protein AVEN_112646-1 [Araneus ventricosus]|uniref:Uncharacterized protein n=1 Tax=Araneus ventricosus TaxID=182803 RepID=A0A4Y2CT73_ARAVE|nr:hypothetical protein AVEN_100488-1 [Araneus ventricosus]GBM07515.1 hypothetical protein AVEN_271391-1 [Araneus ventricosus]GBM07553.1 hypothetical protein AVEN_47011-1 [Araneus ventricosus]GBM07581.1 hypothetical protein AVEN_112646-1 [Araneus ventricosus]
MHQSLPPEVVPSSEMWPAQPYLYPSGMHEQPYLSSNLIPVYKKIYVYQKLFTPPRRRTRETVNEQAAATISREKWPVTFWPPSPATYTDPSHRRYTT